MRKFFSIIVLAWPSYLLVAQPNESISVTDMLHIKSIGNITATEDGTKGAFTVLSIEPDTGKWEHKYLTQVYMVATDGSQPRQLTFAKEGATQPKWSHDGKQIAFVRIVEAKPQIFLLGLDGGEAVQLTKFKYGAANPDWSKDDKHILFTSLIPLKDLLIDSLLNPNKEIPKWPFEKPGFASNDNLTTDTTGANPNGNIKAIRAYLANNEKDNKAKVLDRLNFQEEAVTSANINFNHVFITDATPGTQYPALPVMII